MYYLCNSFFKKIIPEMNLEITIQNIVITAVKSLYQTDVTEKDVQIQKTKKEFDGDITVVVFPFVKVARKSPEATAQEIGTFIAQNSETVDGFNVIKGFLNLKISKTFWIERLNDIFPDELYGTKTKQAASTMMIEYSSPNTNKPLHLGHIRNNLLGFSISEIQKANGWKVVKTNIVNDRGIHICKSMLAWKLFGNGETPQSTGMKGDHLVGKYYVIFDQKYKEEIKQLIKKEGLTEEEAKKTAPLIIQAQEMLLAWENNDPEIRHLWETMNGWVYTGFDETYRKLGVDFDKIYYESETYLEGKDKVLEGLDKGVFYQKEDSSVWADLTDNGLDHKLLLRSDGTSVYMTQDIGTAKLRYDDFDIKKMVYVVGNEQNYHFQVLSVLLDKLGFSWGKDLFHFSYGMVELPEGKMKSREGTVVDADDLIAEMIETARETSEELGKLDNCTEEEKAEVARMVGMGALKYFILKVDPKKNMTFNPKESIDFNGNTGPFIQYTHARIKSVLRKAGESGINFEKPVNHELEISEKEKNLIQITTAFPQVVEEAGKEFSPALVANYCYELVKEYNQFYHDFSILREENTALRNFRLQLSSVVARTIKTGMHLLGIEVPERM